MHTSTISEEFVGCVDEMFGGCSAETDLQRSEMFRMMKGAGALPPLPPRRP